MTSQRPHKASKRKILIVLTKVIITKKVMKRCLMFLPQTSLDKSLPNKLSKLHQSLMHLPVLAKKHPSILNTQKLPTLSHFLERKLTIRLTKINTRKNGPHSPKDSLMEDGNAVPVLTITSREERHARDATKILTLMRIQLVDPSIFSELMKRSRHSNKPKMRKEDKKRRKKELLKASNMVISLVKSDQETGPVPSATTSTGHSENLATHVD